MNEGWDWRLSWSSATRRRIESSSKIGRMRESLSGPRKTSAFSERFVRMGEVSSSRYSTYSMLSDFSSRPASSSAGSS